MSEPTDTTSHDDAAPAPLAGTSSHRAAAAPRRVLLTGATGYIGGRLAPQLLARGHEVVCFVRTPRKLEDRDWAQHERVTVVEGDVGDADAVRDALRGCHAAYYLVHAMESGTHDFAARDRELATAFARGAAASGVDRIIYLGGLGELGEGLSPHLRSRREVGDILRASGVPVTTFRAAIILGSGSASFEILRYLVERLPVMVTPRWVNTECQPIGVVDVLDDLAECLDVAGTIDRTFEIGGSQVVTYRALMQEMARQLGLARRIIVPLPVLTPKLSSLWIGLVTPVSPAIARPLAEGLRNRVVVNDDSVRAFMPRDVMSPAEAIARALEKVRTNEVVTRWTAAGVVPGDPDWAGGTVFVDRREIEIEASADAVHAAVCRVGGGHGWYAAGLLWKVRGLLDQLVGGPGLRRGRRHPETVEFGEALDFWRVVDVRRGRRLGLRAEMRLPGEAMLEFDIEPAGGTDGDRDGRPRHRLVMAARFRPRGLLGLAYWYAVMPFHHFVFSGMLRGIRRAAEAIERGDEAPPATPRSA